MQPRSSLPPDGAAPDGTDNPDSVTQRRWRRGLKIALFSVTPAIVLLVIAELVSAVTIDRRVEIQKNAVDSGSTYTMRVGRWPWSRRSSTRLNSMGFPDTEFVMDSVADPCVRVVFSGDSYVFGDGVDGDSSFVALVERRVAQRSDGQACVRIFNVAERGTTVDRQRLRVLETFDRLRPDVVILGQYQNDLMDLTNPGASLGPSLDSGNAVRLKPRRVPVPIPSLNVKFIKWLTYHSMAFSITRGIKRDELRRWSVLADTTRKELADRLLAEYRRQYEQLVRDLSARGVALGVVILPSKLDILAGRYPEEAFYLDLARDHSVAALRMFPILDAHRSPFAFLVYDGHLNEHGNRLVADALYEWLFTSTPAPIPRLRDPSSAILASRRR